MSLELMAYNNAMRLLSDLGYSKAKAHLAAELLKDNLNSGAKIIAKKELEYIEQAGFGHLGL